MKSTLRMACALLVVMLAACSTPQPQRINFTPKVLDASKATKIGVAMAALPALGTTFPGADCLLCYATASMAHTTLTAHAKTLPTDDLVRLTEDVAELLRKKGAEVVVIPEPIMLKDHPKPSVQGHSLALNDFTALKNKYQINKLLLVEVKSLGFVRTYASYIPTSPPRASIDGLGYIVNLDTHAYEWYQTLTPAQGASGRWNEPPNFPGLTNAYFQMIELAKDRVTRSLSE